MRLLPSDPAFLDYYLLWDRYARLVNIHMHPWDEDAKLPGPEREALKTQLRFEMKLMIED